MNKNTKLLLVAAAIVVSVLLYVGAITPRPLSHFTGLCDYHEQDFTFQGLNWQITNVGQCDINGGLATNGITATESSITIHQEMNTQDNDGTSGMALSLPGKNIREFDSVSVFTSVSGSGPVNGGGGLVVVLKDEIGQEVTAASGSRGCGTGSGCSWGFGATELTISADKKQVIGKVEGGLSTVTSTAHLGSQWTLILRLEASGTKWGGASQTTSISFFDSLPKPAVAPTIDTTTGTQQEVISPIAEEERIQENLLPTVPREIAAEGISLGFIALIIFIIVGLYVGLYFTMRKKRG